MPKGLGLLLPLALSSCSTLSQVPPSPTPRIQPSPTTTAQEPHVYVDEPMIVRTGPGTVFSVAAQISPGHTYHVLGKNIEWWLIDIGDGVTGWIYGGVYLTNFVGDPGSVPSIPSPPTPSPVPTPTCPPFPPTQPSPEEAIAQAHTTLLTFFALLSQRRYQQASRLYSGPYDVLRDDNPLLDPNDLPGLLRSACEINGFQCLPVREVVSEVPISAHEFQFLLEFANADGSLFVRGPCCGASEEDEPPQSQFPFPVVMSCDGRYTVPELPVYVP